MLSVNLFKDIEEVFDLEFVQNKTCETLIICPSPKEADGIRSKLHDSINVNVITISKFVNDLKEELGEMWNVKRKSDLIFTLSTIWKMKMESPSHEVFMQAFNLFTEFRSYTLDISVLDDIFEKLDEELVVMIKFFWFYMEQEGIIDEQKSYELLVAKLRDKSFENTQRNIIFWSFSHLNALQLDLVQSLALGQEVYIPFSEEVFAKTNRQDWIRWIKPEKLEREGDNEAIDYKVTYFPKGRLAGYLGQKLEKEVGISKIIIGQKNPDLEMLCEIPIKNLGYRASADVFATELEKCFDEIKLKLRETEVTSELIQFLKEKNIRDIKEQNFKSLTVNKILIDLLKEYYELSEINESFKLFDFKILKEVSALDLPRTYFVPISDSEENVHVCGLEELSENDKNIVLVVSSDQNSLKASGQKFNAEITNVLAGLGPVRRKELEFLEVKRKINELARRKELHVFVEEGLVNHDLAWADIFDGLKNVEEIKYEIPEGVRTSDYFYGKLICEDKPTKLSATSLQSYLDCPRKFYFEYVERLRQEIDANNEILPFELGQIEHQVIGEYFDQNQEIDQSKLYDLSKKCLEEFLAKEKKSVRVNDYEKALLEISSYAKNGLVELYKIRNVFPKMSWKFEKSLRDFGGFSGSIDFYAETSLGVIVLDFKRSSSSIPSATDLKEFNKIQLWFYLNEVLKGENKNLLFGGYLNLNSVEESLFMISDKSIVGKLLEEEFGQGSLKEMRGFDFAESYDEFKGFLKELIERVQLENKYLPKPLTEKVCTYCIVNKVCPRRAL